MKPPHLRRLAPLSLAAVLSLQAITPLFAQEESVRPGINDPYKKPNIEGRVKQFEGESREIFRQREAIVEACNLKPGMDVADVGAGTGLFTRLFAPKVSPQGTVWAVDITEPFLEHVKKTCKEQEIKNVVCVVCTPTSTELEAESMDIIFTCDTYHHFEYPATVLASIRQALKPDGQLIVIDFKKIEGVTPEGMMKHVRGDQALTTKEVLAAGFKLVEEVDFMEGQYFLRFEKATDQ